MAAMSASIPTGSSFQGQDLSPSLDDPPDSEYEDLAFTEMDPSGRYGKVCL